MVNPRVADGVGEPTAPQYAQTPDTPTVTIGGQTAQVIFSGLAGGYAGLYQVYAIVPPGISPGDQVPVTITIGGQTSEAANTSVR